MFDFKKFVCRLRSGRVLALISIIAYFKGLIFVDCMFYESETVDVNLI